MLSELINRRRQQVLVHSCIYYRLGEQLIDDFTFDSWAMELVALQEKYPEEAGRLPHSEAFEGFDGSTGFNLPHANPHIIARAQSLIRYNQELKLTEEEDDLWDIDSTIDIQWT